MKLIPILLCVIFLDEILYVATVDHSLDLPDATPQDFPFLGVIRARKVCGALLVAENYVVAPATCVYRVISATIYLGFQGYPYYKSHHSETHTQIVSSSQIIVHEDFGKPGKENHYINNVAIVKLSSPAKLSDKIQPGKFISRQEAQMLEGKLVSITGWLLSKDTNMKTTTVVLRNQDTCRYLFGSQFLSGQEICVRWPIKTRLNLLGNAVTLGKKIIGFQSLTPECIRSTSNCTSNDVVFNLMPYLNWLALKMDKPIEVLTNIASEESKNGNVNQTTDDTFDAIISITKEKSDNTQLEKKVENLHKELENALEEIRAIKSSHNTIVSSLNKEIGEIKIEVNNSRAQDHQNVSTFQEELSSVKSGVNKCLAGQKSLHDLEAQFITLDGNIQRSVVEKLEKLDKKLVDLNDNTRNGLLNDTARTFDDAKSEFERKQREFELRIWKEVEAINDTIKRSPEMEERLQRLFTELQTELKQHSDDKDVLLETLQKKLNEITVAIEADVLHDNLVVEDITKLQRQQKTDLETHINEEAAHMNSLWSQVKNLTDSVNKINEYIFAPPTSN